LAGAILVELIATGSGPVSSSSSESEISSANGIGDDEESIFQLIFCLRTANKTKIYFESPDLS
jgi:hypothetical protein